MPPRLKPNAPCLCGSGRKYKKCCRAAVESPISQPEAVAIQQSLKQSFGWMLEPPACCGRDLKAYRVALACGHTVHESCLLRLAGLDPAELPQHAGTGHRLEAILEAQRDGAQRTQLAFACPQCAAPVRQVGAAEPWRDPAGDELLVELQGVVACTRFGPEDTLVDVAEVGTRRGLGQRRGGRGG